MVTGRRKILPEPTRYGMIGTDVAFVRCMEQYGRAAARTFTRFGAEGIRLSAAHSRNGVAVWGSGSLTLWEIHASTLAGGVLRHQLRGRRLRAGRTGPEWSTTCTPAAPDSSLEHSPVTASK